MLYNRDDRGGALTRRQQEGMSRRPGNDWFWQRDPWQEMQEMQRRMDQLFSGAFGQGWGGLSQPMGRMMGQMAEMGVAEPDIDFRETEKEYVIRAALPGIAPGDIDVQATVDSIRLTAQTRQEEQPQQQNAQQGNSQNASNQGGAQQAQGQMMQHRQGQFSRVSRFEFAYALPEDIKPNEVRANFRNGVLDLQLPKANPDTSRNKAVSIPIQGDSSAAQISAGASRQTASQTSGAGNAASTNSEHQPGSRTGDGAGAKKTTAPAGQTASTQTSNAGVKKI
jgi:HSP20 family protein